MRLIETLIVAAPQTLREKELADSYDAGRQLAPLLLLFFAVLVAGVVGLVFFLAKVARRRAEMRKIAGE